ncbi:CshA/CshB family fibrillar adhesin-related protein [Mucilaginibacter hurinus]|nr:CshA/CshB family fibrillar adhesin-related protein [Mucilaginibacter hurinus]
MQVFTKASAQYAVGGSAGTNLVNSVYWLTWDQNATGSTLISQPAGANAGNLINGTYVWQFSPTVRITAIISNLQTVGGTAMLAYTPGSFSGDGLDLIYSGNNLPKPDSRGVPASGISAPYGGTATFDIDVKVAILINGVYTDVVYPGMIIADAESIDAGGEYISGTTPNSIAWQLLNKRTQGNDADERYKLDLTNNGRSFRLYADLLPGNFGVQAVMFARGARELDDVSMKGSGLTAMAIGFVLPFDLGDNPEGYGTTGHYMEEFQITDYFAGDGTYAVVDYNTTPLVAQATVFIGADNVDPDGQPVGNANSNNDNLTGNDDENSLNPAALPNVKVNQAGDIVITLRATNNKNVAARLRGWLDFNQDGIFNADEQVSVNVPANTVNQNFILTYPNALFRNNIRTGPLYSRFRITTTALIDNTNTPLDERSVSFAADGETEDYRLKDVLGVTISGTVFNDGNGGADGTITGEGLQDVSGQLLYAYLVDNTNTIVNKAQVAGDGTYALSNANNGTYRVAISTNDVALGASLSDVTANLPSNWKPSGEAYGINNAGNTGIEPGTPDMLVQVRTPGTSLNVSGVNFGINQIPVAVADQGTTTKGTAVTLNIPANDTDADGTVNVATVLLIDPADNVKRASVTIAGQGTFTVNPANGSVTFTPLATFTGKTIPLPYTIKDNFGSESVSALITIDVKPTGIDDTDSTTPGTPVSTNVKANDGQNLATATVTATNGTNGTTAVDGAGNVIYTPNAGFTGTDTYTYFLTTPDGVVSDPITVTINVTGSSGTNDATTTPINTPVTTDVRANDGPAGVDATVNPTNGAHGTTTVTPTGQVIYTPQNGYVGKDTYTYTLTKNGVTTPPITVTVDIKPTGVNDSGTTPVNTPITTTVKSNDGPSGTGTTVNATNGTNGTTVVNADGTVTYTPATGFIGNDTYTYTLTTADGVISDPITVNITVFAASIVLNKVATNSGNAAGDVINYTLTVTNTGNTALTNVVITDAGADAGSISPSVIPTLDGGEEATVTARHTLTQAEINSGSFSNQAAVTATDQSNNTVGGVSDDPNTTEGNDSTVVTFTPQGNAGVSLTKRGEFTEFYIIYTLVIRNTGQTALTSVSITDPKLGITNSPINVGGGLAAGDSVVTVLPPYTLTQADKDAGTVVNNATVNAQSGNGNSVTANAGTTTVVPKSPVAVNDNTLAFLNKPKVVEILKNDNPGNSTFDPQSIEIIKQPEHGTIQIGNGVVTYTPDPDYSGPDEFTYRVKDLFGYYTNVATVTLNISPNSTIKIPTLFTPNGDGINDLFEIRGIEEFVQNDLVIVNRWGNEVYKKKQYDNSWAGTGLNEGTYYYILRVLETGSTNWTTYKGYITLIRTLRK